MANLTKEDIELLKRRIEQLKLCFQEYDRRIADIRHWATNNYSYHREDANEREKEIRNIINEHSRERNAVWEDVRFLQTLIDEMITNVE